MLQARLIGTFRLATAEGSDVTPRARKAAAMVAYLLLSGGPVARRERLASLLWSEKSENQARDSLRQCLAELRRSVVAGPDGCVLISPRDVALRPGSIEVDVEVLRAAVVRGDTARLAEMLAADDLDLLPGFDELDPAFRDWLIIERERWSQALVADLMHLIEARAGARKDLVAITEAVLRLDPYQEEALRLTMGNLAASAQAPAAVALFDRYHRRLRREYEINPPTSLVAYADRLRHGRTTLRVASGSGPVGLAEAGPAIRPVLPAGAGQDDGGRPLPRIAVAVASARAAGSGLDQMSEAFRHDLIGTLSRFKEWAVIALSTDEPEPLSTPEREPLATTGVDYTLRAMLLEAGGFTRVEIKLVECRPTGSTLTERFAMPPGRWISTLNDICCRVGAWLQLAISTTRLRRVARQTPEQLSAYDLWLKAHYLTSLWTRNAEEEAQIMLERAIALDPGLACAYSSLAGILHTRHIVCPGWPEVADDRQRALALARKAVELDRMDCRNHVILGWAHTLAERFDSADFHFHLAVELNPSNASTIMSAAGAAVFSGAHKEAAAMAARAFALNPVPPAFYFAYRAPIAFFTQDLAGCLEDTAKAPYIFPYSRMWAAAALVRLGRLAQARAELKACYAEVRARWAGPAEPDERTIHVYLRTVYAFRHDEDKHRLVSSLDRAAAV
jgi:DNA-binding SARP family transcriptional activator/TolB-like protein